VQLLQGQILFALLLFVVAALVGPGGYSTTDTQSTEAAVPLGAKATATAGRVDRNPTAKAIGRLGLVAVVYCIVAGLAVRVALESSSGPTRAARWRRSCGNPQAAV
jgi:hypothetical protein